MVSIDVKAGENIESALRRFNREVLRAGILQEFRDHEFNITPSEKRKLRNQEKQRKVAQAKRWNKGG